MSKHEFYADPTLFDHWQNSAGRWFCAQAGRVCPYGWVSAFFALGLVALGVSIALLGVSLRDVVAPFDPAWNRALAQGVAAVVALIAAQALVRCGFDAWPPQQPLPRLLHELAGTVGWCRPKPAPATVRAAGRTAEREATQAFFAEVRAAGVNVSIARALFAAGIRSSQHLRRASDRQLASIHGVGPATVHKLRAHFRHSA